MDADTLDPDEAVTRSCSMVRTATWSRCVPSWGRLAAVAGLVAGVLDADGVGLGHELGQFRCHSGGTRAREDRGVTLTWWGYVDLNHGPLPYQGSALTG